MGTVSKSDIIRDTTTATGAGVSPVVVKQVVEAFLSQITIQAEAGNIVNLIGFGRFEIKTRAARVGRNPSTGAPVDIAESRKLSFKPSKKTA